MTRREWTACSAAAGLASVGLACLIALVWQPPVQPSHKPMPLRAESRSPAGAVNPTPEADSQPRRTTEPAGGEYRYYRQMRSRLIWVDTNADPRKLPAP